MQPVAFQPVTIGWLLAVLILLLLIIGLPDPKYILLFVAGLAITRLL
jgi:hypothetical protein